MLGYDFSNSYYVGDMASRLNKNHLNNSVLNILINILTCDVNMLEMTCGGNITCHKYGTYIVHSYCDWILNNYFHASQKLNHKHHFLKVLR